MTVTDFIVIATFIFEVVAIISGGIWFVANMQSATNQLKATIEHLAMSVNKLQDSLQDIDEKQHEHDLQIAVLEHHCHANEQHTKESCYSDKRKAVK